MDQTYYLNDYSIIHQIDVGDKLGKYIYLIHCIQTKQTAVIDPPAAEPVLDILAQKGWHLNMILCTHFHPDDTGGNEELKQATNAIIVASDIEMGYTPGISRDGLSFGLSAGSKIKLGQLIATVLSVPGHTQGHIAYHFENERWLFSGDTIFTMGVGALLEGGLAELLDNLERISSMREDTLIFPSHENALLNARFAMSVDPRNKALKKHFPVIEKLKANGIPSVPVLLAQEKALNPFLRLESQDIQTMMSDKPITKERVLELLLEHKDHFMMKYQRYK
jgi:hydroxyacylglutathione hydrolase